MLVRRRSDASSCRYWAGRHPWRGWSPTCAQPRPVPSASYFTPFLKVPTKYSLMIWWSSLRILVSKPRKSLTVRSSIASAILVGSTDPALFTARLQIFEDGAEAGRGEVELVLVAEALGERLGLLVADLRRHVLAERHHRQHAVVAADADRGRAAGQMGVEGVVAQIGAGIDAGLDQQVHVRAPVAGQQRLRARGLDLGDDTARSP